MAYAWLTYGNARQQLAARLADPSNIFWTDAENGLYIQEALRVWNVLSFTWKTTFTFTLAAASTPQWFSLGTQTGSPRLRSQTDTAVYTLLEYHLLEPPSGGTWTGTTQFNISDLALALQRCRDAVIQGGNCNQAIITSVIGAPNQTTYALPDNVLDIARVRFLPLGGSPVTLVRNDETGLDFYQTDWTQTPAGTPTQYNIASTGPLVMQVDIAPAVEGIFELLVLLSGGILNPPTPSLLNVPDDFTWMLKWGVLADLLDRESEATDRQRAEFARSRYAAGMAWLQQLPWLIEAYINGVPAELVSAAEMDLYDPEWDSNPPDFSTVVTAGTDTFCLIADPNVPTSITLNVLANAPVPVNDGDYIQCSRDVWDAILDYAQFLAAFKQGGAEFQSVLGLEQNMYNAAILTNGRLRKLGLFADVFADRSSAETRWQERFTTPQGGQ